MGVVYAAYDPKLDRKIAIKVMRRRSGTDPEFAQNRMLREAQALAKLSHPNVVAVHDTGLIDGQVFVAMDYVQGDDVRRWLRSRPRSRQAVIDALCQAGEGLAAAHAAGIVHRDFKPDNVLVGVDGRVQVLDFGLARVPDNTEEQSVARRRSSRRRGTDDGRIIPRLRPVSNANPKRPPAGTPAYMAPEQHLRSLVDAKADQFAFCVTLYEALCGRPPHATDGAGLVHAIIHGEIREPPRHSPLPRSLRKVIWRGLATEPADRYPSMKALLADLQRPRGRKRRVAAASVAVALLAGVTAFSFGGSASDGPCEESDTRIEDVWNPDRREQVRAAFKGSGRPEAQRSFDATASRLDAYGVAWTAMYDDACRATHVRHEQSDAMLDLRMECLGGRKARLGALVETLTEADAASIDRAPVAAASLGSLTQCANADSLRERMPLPSGEAAQTEITELSRRIAQAVALQDTGQPEAALGLLESVTERAKALDWAPLTAEAHFELGATLQLVGRWSDAEANLIAAAVAAELARDDRLLAKTRTLLVLVVGDRNARPSEGHVWARLAQAAITRTGDDPGLASKLETNIAHVLDREAKPDLALAHHERALLLLEQVPGPQNIRLAAAHGDLAGALTEVGRRQEALGHAEQAYRLWSEEVGPEHIHTATAKGMLGYVLDDMGRTDEAIAQYIQAAAIAKRALGGDNPVTADHIANLAVARARAGDIDRAIEDFQRVVDIHTQSSGEQHADVAEATFNLASALGMAERHTEALRHHKRALALRESLFGEDHLEIRNSLDGVANQLQQLGRPAEALVHRERGLAIQERASGDDDAALVHPLSNLAYNLQMVGDFARARTVAERAVALVGAPSLRPSTRAFARAVLAVILGPKGRDPNRARQLIAEATLELGDTPSASTRRVLAEARAGLGRAAQSSPRPETP